MLSKSVNASCRFVARGGYSLAKRKPFILKTRRSEMRGKLREKQKIESGKQKAKVLDCFEVKCICSSLGESELLFCFEKVDRRDFLNQHR
jgi:hypothetical protein